MTRRSPELRAPRRDDHAETADEWRAERGIRRCRGKRVALRVHGACERGIGRSDAFGDPRPIAGMASAPFEAPRVARRRQLGVRTSILDQGAALLRVSLVEKTADRNVDLLWIAEETFAVRGRELERLGIAVQELERARAERRDVVALEDVQGHRDERALRPRAAGIDVDTAVRRVRGAFDANALRTKVVLRDRAA